MTALTWAIRLAAFVWWLPAILLAKRRASDPCPGWDPPQRRSVRGQLAH